MQILNFLIELMPFSTTTLPIYPGLEEALHYAGLHTPRLSCTATAKYYNDGHYT